MDNWTKLKRLYVDDHNLKDHLKSPQTRLNAVERIEALFSIHFPHILKQIKFLNNYKVNDFKTEVALKKGAKLSGSEQSVINGLFKFLPEL